jgi:hypothetical protein
VSGLSCTASAGLTVVSTGHTVLWCAVALQVTFVGPGFTRKPPKYERFIRPTGASDSWLRFWNEFAGMLLARIATPECCLLE